VVGLGTLRLWVNTRPVVIGTDVLDRVAAACIAPARQPARMSPRGFG